MNWCGQRFVKMFTEDGEHAAMVEATVRQHLQPAWLVHHHLVQQAGLREHLRCGSVQHHDEENITHHHQFQQVQKAVHPKLR